MRTSTTQELKQELAGRKPAELLTLCLRLARFKKENKELLTYLLFEAGDEESYIRSVQSEITELFETVNRSQLYLAKKTLRKIVRIINKYSRYSGNKQTDIELRIFFCGLLKDSGIPFRQNAVLSNLYESQLKKIRINLAGMHEDLQHDYQKTLTGLEHKDQETGLWTFFGRKKKK